MEHRWGVVVNRATAGTMRQAREREYGWLNDDKRSQKKMDARSAGTFAEYGIDVVPLSQTTGIVRRDQMETNRCTDANTKHTTQHLLRNQAHARTEKKTRLNAIPPPALP